MRGDVYSVSGIKRILARHGLATSRTRGQHFLPDKGTLDRIADAAELHSDECVLEIGPGLGALTRVLSHRVRKVVAVEIDAGFMRALEQTLEDLTNVRVIHQDFLKLDLRRWSAENLDSLPAPIVANLPYSVTTPVLSALFETPEWWRVAVLLLQKEVAHRLAAGPGTPDYGSLSVYAQFAAEIDVVGLVPAGVFYPPPKVESAIVRLRPRKEPPAPVRDPRILQRVARAAFAQRRKTLLNSLGSIEEWGREGIRSALESVGIEPGVRGETLTLAEFAAVANALTPPEE